MGKEKPPLTQIVLDGENAVGIFHPNVFNELNDDQKQAVYLACGIDPNHPNAYELAIQIFNRQLVLAEFSLRKQLQRQLHDK